jgi:hypothetical protein
MTNQPTSQQTARFTDELMWFLVCVACDHNGEAMHSLQDLKELGGEMGLGEEWTIAVDDVRADLLRTEMHRRAGSILRLHSLAQAVMRKAKGQEGPI